MEEILQKEVNKIVKEKGYKKDYDAKFKISILLGDSTSNDKESHKIVLSIFRCGLNRSRIIFPKSSSFDYISLEEEMTYLLNSTL